MNDIDTVLAGVALTAAICALVVLTLGRPLRTILIELCGTPERAVFWSAFSRVVLCAVPLIFALHFQPEPGAGVPVVLALATQLQWGLIGVVIAVVVLGLVLGAFVLADAFGTAAGAGAAGAGAGAVAGAAASAGTRDPGRPAR